MPLGAASSVIAAGPDAFPSLLSLQTVHKYNRPSIITMFSRTTIFAALALVLTGQVLALPVPAASPVGVVSEALKTIPVYVKRQIPAEVPVKSPNGQVVPYAKRQIPAEVPVKSPNGQVVPYTKRQIPAEIPVKSLNGQIVPYTKRQIPAEIAVKSLNGQIVPY
jgi:hypothetical protein